MYLTFCLNISMGKGERDRTENYGTLAEFPERIKKQPVLAGNKRMRYLDEL